MVLEKLHEFLETTNELKDHVVSAMIYPAILSLTGGISIIVLLTFVLPRFSVIFSEIGGSLPLTTQILLLSQQRSSLLVVDRRGDHSGSDRYVHVVDKNASR